MPRQSRKAKPAAATGAWKPRAFFWALAAALIALSIAELVNALRRPTLLRLAGLPGSPGLAVYQRGRAESREAWLFHEPAGDDGPPLCFQRIDCTAADENTGEIRWSFTGSLLYATRRLADTIDTRPVWAYDYDTRTLYAVDDAAVKHSLPVRLTTERDLVDRINHSGGKGPLALAWYDFGKRGDYLPAWKATRWERKLPRQE